MLPGTDGLIVNVYHCVVGVCYFILHRLVCVWANKLMDSIFVLHLFKKKIFRMSVTETILLL